MQPVTQARAELRGDDALAPPAVIGEIACLVGPDAAHAHDVVGLLTGDQESSVRTWCDGNVAVAWQGSAELDVSDDLIVLAEGRLDNRSELAAQAHQPATAALPRLLAALWRRRGAEMLDLIVGELAAVVVERSTAQVHAFRDLCAGRPLYISRLAGKWAVASEWRPLAFAGPTSPAPNPEWFVSGFLGQSIEPRATPYVGVEMVLPGYVASAGGCGWSQVRHADWHIPRLRDTRRGAYAEAFRAIFDEAVRCRAESAGPTLGICLSGGLDSTSAIASANAVLPDQRRVAVAMAMIDPVGDERVIQRMIAEQCADELRWVDLEPYNPMGPNGPEAVFERFGAPPLAVNWFLQDAMAEEACAAGLRVVLSGEDGDGCVGGNPAFLADLLVTGRWLRWLREVNDLRELRKLSGRELLEESLYMAAPPPLRRAFIRRKGMTLAPPVLSAQLRDALRIEERLLHSPHNRAWRPGHAFRLGQGEVGLTEQVGPIFTNIAQTWRARGISFTHPWNDRRVMSFCMGLPYPHVVTGGLTKIILRQAMADRLPEILLKRWGKSDISDVARRGAFGPKRGYVIEGLRLARCRPEWFDAAAVASAEAAFRSEDAGSEAPALRLAMFASWLEWCGV